MSGEEKKAENVMTFFGNVVSGFLGIRTPASGPVLLDRQNSCVSIESCESFQPRDEASGAEACEGATQVDASKDTSLLYEMPSPTSGFVVARKKSFPRQKAKKKLEDEFELERELGRGHFGVVRACSRKATGERMACKSIDKAKLKYW